MDMDVLRMRHHGNGYVAGSGYGDGFGYGDGYGDGTGDGNGDGLIYYEQYFL